MTAPKIEFKNITKIFETRSQTIVAVKDFNMQVETGDFVSIIGPSGCGKSTLIRMLDGIIQPTEGELFIEGTKLDTSKPLPRETLRKMGFIFQKPNLLPWYTLRQNVVLTNMIIGCGITETTGIYALLISFMILFAL